jgi:hypothetical protein
MPGYTDVIDADLSSGNESTPATLIRRGSQARADRPTIRWRLRGSTRASPAIPTARGKLLKVRGIFGRHPFVRLKRLQIYNVRLMPGCCPRRIRLGGPQGRV